MRVAQAVAGQERGFLYTKASPSQTHGLMIHASATLAERPPGLPLVASLDFKTSACACVRVGGFDAKRRIDAAREPRALASWRNGLAQVGGRRGSDGIAGKDISALAIPSDASFDNL